MDEYKEILEELDRDESTISVRLEKRKYDKPVTVISGIVMGDGEMKRVASTLKKKFAAGGAVKDSQILLQGNHLDGIEAALRSLGFKNIVMAH